MRVQIVAISLLLSTTLSGSSAATSVAPAPAPVAPAPFRPVVPGPVPSAPGARLAPAQPAPGAPPVPAPSAATRLPPGSQPMQSGPSYSGTNGMVPQYGAQANPFSANGQAPSTNGFASQFANTNASGAAGNPFGVNSQAGGSSNQLGAFPNAFPGSNRLGFHYTNQFGTNLVLEDEGLTRQDRVLVGQIRKELLPVIRREQLPIHLACQNGLVIITGVALSAQQAQQLAAVVRQTPGVRGVNNQLRVNPNFAGQGELAREPGREDEAFSPRDRDLLKDIRGRMRHRHEEGGVSESVRIIARNGVVTLTGFVGSAAEEQALVASAQSTPGVVRVDNDLQVRGQTAGQPARQPPGSGVGSAASPGGVSTGAGVSSGAGSSFAFPSRPGGSLPNTNTPPR